MDQAVTRLFVGDRVLTLRGGPVRFRSILAIAVSYLISMPITTLIIKYTP